MPLEAAADLRNRVFASRWFQDGAAMLPGIKSIAHRRAAQLFDLTAGFVYSQILLACVELDLFERLRRGPVPIETLAEETGLPVDAVERLGRAAAALSLLSVRSGGRLALGAQGAALLGNPSVFSMIRHHRILFDDLRDPVGLLRGPKGQTGLGAFWGYAGDPDAASLPDERVGAYSELMAATQAFIAEEVTSAHPFRRYRAIMDVGGGLGAFLLAVAKAAPDARLTLFDLPAVAEKAARRFADAGIGDRATAVGGNFLRDPLPEGAELVTLVRVLHDQDDGDAMTLLRAVHAALPPGGRVLVAEPMAGTRGAAAMGDAYFGIYLWAMGRGAPRPPSTIMDMLRTAGFRKPRLVRTRRPLLTRMIIAEK